MEGFNDYWKMYKKKTETLLLRLGSPFQIFATVIAKIIKPYLLQSVRLISFFKLSVSVAFYFLIASVP
jgi:hypothetical protein